jgi:RND family efflux transporter MFP subunit
VLLGLGLGLAIAVSTNYLGNRQQAPAEPAEAANPAAAQAVTIFPAQRGPITQSLNATGTVQAYDLLEVTAPVNGLQIREVRVQAGDRVAAGQVLAVLDDTVLQSQRRQAEAGLSAAEAQVQQQIAAQGQAQATLAEAEENFRRAEALAERGAISQQELTGRRTQVITAQEGLRVAAANIASSRANVASQQAEIARLQTEINQTLVRAPAAGLIAERQATVGDTASAANPLYTLIRDDLLELAVKLPQPQLAQVQPGTPVELQATGDPRRLQGRVRVIDPVVDPQTRQATVKISLPPGDLRPGMFLQAAIVTAQRQGLLVPATAVIPQADGQFRVYTLTPENTARAVSVTLGARIPAQADTPAQIEIPQGLNVGVPVIVEGASYLQDGDPVQTVSGDQSSVE